jgi:hypothetical protein
MENQNPPFPPPPPQGNPYNQNPYQQNPYQQNPYQHNPMGMRQDLPNHGGILALGIISIALCWCYGIVGIVCGIIALVMGNKAMELYNTNPNVYSEKSYKNAKAGRVCAIIGLSLSIVWLIYFVVSIIFLGAGTISRMPWDRY